MTKTGLTHCTLTGFDDSTLLEDVIRLSNAYPIAEWGFLYSANRKGTPGRYPSLDSLHYAFENLDSNVRVALHICGRSVSALLNGSSFEVAELVEMVEERGGRIQLNFNQTREPLNLIKLKDFLDAHPALQVITQHNLSNKVVWESVRGHENHAVLFDSSGGRGILSDGWQEPLPNILCGYAGGLGHENLDTELPRIATAAAGHSFWIDMEGSLRVTDEDDIDWFDTDRCERCLELVSAAMNSV